MHLFLDILLDVKQNLFKKCEYKENENDGCNEHVLLTSIAAADDDAKCYCRKHEPPTCLSAKPNEFVSELTVVMNEVLVKEELVRFNVVYVLLIM